MIITSAEESAIDIRHLFERDNYWCARSGIGVHYLQEVFKNVHPELVNHLLP